MKIGNVVVSVHGNTIRWISGMGVDADGAPRAYAPPGSGLEGLDYLANAGSPGKWYGLACNAQGIPYVQQPGHPAPGYYVSTTSLCNSMYGQKDPRRYVDSSAVPYIAIPPELKPLGANLGDVLLVMYGDKKSPAIIADIGPHNALGEGSVALHQALGVDPFRGKPKHKLVGIDAGVSFLVFAGSTRGWPRDWNAVVSQVNQLAPLAINA